MKRTVAEGFTTEDTENAEEMMVVASSSAGRSPCIGPSAQACSNRPTIIVEVKSVDRLLPIHEAQVLTYLRLTGLPAALLLNFNVRSLRPGIRRLLG